MGSCGVWEEDYCREITDAHLEEFSRDYGENWRQLPAYLDIKGIVVKDAEWLPGERLRRHNFFTEWKCRKCPFATYKKLVYALLKIKNRLDAEALCKILKSCPKSECASESAQAAPNAITGMMSVHTMHGTMQYLLYFLLVLRCWGSAQKVAESSTVKIQ